MENSSNTLKKHGHPLLYGAICGGFASFILSSYVTSDLGDLPSIAFYQMFLAMVGTVAGGAGGVLIKEFRNRQAWPILRIIKVIVLIVIIAPYFYYFNQFVNSSRAFRTYLLNGYALNNIRNYNRDITEYITQNGKLPIGLDEFKNKYKTLYEDVVVEYTPLSLEKNVFKLHTYHKKGDKEFILSSESNEIFWRTMGANNWESIINYRRDN